MWEPPDWPSGDEDDFYLRREPKTCERCDKRNLEWVDIGGGRWRLYDGMKPHKCPRSTAADDFAGVP